MANEPIIAKAYDLLKVSLPFFNRLPRSYRFTLADRVQNMESNLLELLIETYYTKGGQRKVTLLMQVNRELEKLRHYYRLGYELGLYHSGPYQDFSRRIDEIGRMAGGWLKALQGKPEQPK